MFFQQHEADKIVCGMQCHKTDSQTYSSIENDAILLSVSAILIALESTKFSLVSDWCDVLELICHKTKQQFQEIYITLSFNLEFLLGVAIVTTHPRHERNQATLLYEAYVHLFWGLPTASLINCMLCSTTVVN
jgi:hypothetical protein